MDYDKLGPDLAATIDDYQRLGRLALPRHRPRVALVSTEAAKGPRSVVFVRCADDADLTHLAGSGLRVNQARGHLRTGIVALDGVEAVSEDPVVERLVAARHLRLLMDVAPAKVGVPALRHASGLAGRGVVVGTVDSGIEGAHPDFAGRVLRIWDQTVAGPGVAESGYGLELTGALLEASRDTIGHGTHVAGIAAGADPIFGGVAPESELVVVKTDLIDAHVADGVRYVFRVADEMGVPAVVNLSLGGQADPHDGSDPLSAIIDAASGPGRIVCCAAGNEGNDDIHAQVVVGEGRCRTVTFTLPLGSAVVLHG